MGVVNNLLMLPAPPLMEDTKVTRNCSKFTSRELSEFNKPGNARVAYEGKVYNVSEFVTAHPGGVEQIMMGAGHDITHLFNAYHKPDTIKYLDKYYEGELIDNEMPLYTLKEHSSQFYNTLKKRVSNKFKELNIDAKIDHKMFAVYFILSLMLFLSWYFMLIYSEYWSIAVGCSALWGLFTAMVMFVIGHDVSHYCITHKPWIWTAIKVFVESSCGLSTYCWIYQHTYGHHNYTNIDGVDPDISTPDTAIWRIKDNQKWIKRYRIQYLYMPLLYTLLSIKMKLQDIPTMISLNKDDIRMNPPLKYQLIQFYCTKLIHLIFTLVIPILYMSIWRALVYHMIYELVLGLWLALVTQLNHVSTEVSMIKPDANNTINNITWSHHQVLATKDYATDSKLWTLLTGALNHQTAHHLFPGVLQSHYHIITPIVKTTCEEFGINYHCENDMISAIKQHLKYLFKMGQPP